MDQKELAVRTGLDKKTINQIVKGVHPLSQQTAIKLERATGVPARMWNNLEMQYRERLARQQDQKRLRSELQWLKSIPVRVLQDRGIIPKTPDKVSLLRHVLTFFGVSNTAEWQNYWLGLLACRFRRSRAFEMKPGAAAAWIRLGEIEAQRIQCAPYNEARFRSALKEIRGLTDEPAEAWQPRMVDLCASAGVALTFIKEIKGCPASGMARWITPDRAYIQLSLRHKSDEHFWFSFLHEAGHILKDRKKAVFIDDGDSDDELESRANKFATDFLIPPAYADRLHSLTSQSAIRQFARQIGIAPGIVVGQMQKHRIIPYSYYNDLKRRLAWADNNQ
jgi:plasmid maintenance system antidote protein VapI